MSSSTVNFNWRVRTLPPALLLLAVLVLRPLEQRIALPAFPSGPSLAALSGHGGLLAVVGGMRSVVAGMFWLKTNLAWERRDAVGTTVLLQLTVAADDRPLYYWLNGARMLAYDLPVWNPEGVPDAVRQRIQFDQATAALAFLEQGQRTHGPSAELYMEMAAIYLRVLDDREGAARLFRQAAELPGAPYYAARIHAELLRELGRPVEALAWLQQILPGLPADDPAARRAVVLDRIKVLELEVAGK